jgi:hypothetical protein
MAIKRPSTGPQKVVRLQLRIARRAERLNDFFKSATRRKFVEQEQHRRQRRAERWRVLVKSPYCAIDKHAQNFCAVAGQFMHGQNQVRGVYGFVKIRPINSAAARQAERDAHIIKKRHILEYRPKPRLARRILVHG